MNQPSIYKRIITAQVPLEVDWAITKKAEADNTSRNSVINYYLLAGLEKIISSFSAKDRKAINDMIAKNKERRG